MCDRSYLGPLVSTVNFAGGAVGSVFCGWWGDKRGRKRVLIIVLYMQGIVGVCFAIASYFELYMFLRFARGFFIQVIISFNFCNLLLIECFRDCKEFHTLS